MLGSAITPQVSKLLPLLLAWWSYWPRDAREIQATLGAYHCFRSCIEATGLATYLRHRAFQWDQCQQHTSAFCENDTNDPGAGEGSWAPRLAGTSLSRGQLSCTEVDGFADSAAWAVTSLAWLSLTKPRRSEKCTTFICNDFHRASDGSLIGLRHKPQLRQSFLLLIIDFQNTAQGAAVVEGSFRSLITTLAVIKHD